MSTRRRLLLSTPSGSAGHVKLLLTRPAADSVRNTCVLRCPPQKNSVGPPKQKLLQISNFARTTRPCLRITR